MTQRYTIIGAGLAGLSAGYNLAKGGKSIDVLEREDYVGGLAASFQKDGFTFDLGPHRFHTRNKRVDSQVQELLGENKHWRNRLSRIFMLGKFFHYPLKAGNVITSLPPTLLVRSFFDYLVVRIQNRIKPIPDDCFQNWVLKRFGKTLYRLFFGTYTEKAWGMPCTQISADWAAQRITVLNLMDTVKKTLIRPKDEPRSLVSKFFYPIRGGVGSIATRYAEELLKLPNNSIATGVTIERFRWEGDRVVAIDYVKNGKSSTDRVDGVISTIPITIAIDLFDPPPPPEVIAARRALRYKAIVFVMLKLNREKVTDDHWIYLPEQHLKVHRISEFKNFSHHCTPDGKTMVAAEITCNYEDQIWNMDQQGLIDLAASDLERVGLLKRAEVFDGLIHRERYSYPLYDLEYAGHVDTCLNWMKQFKNFYSTGRQGLFQYGNMDHSIAMGLVLAERLLKGVGADHDKLLGEEAHVD
jgi:protoporphyrinogen oxidase